MVHELLEAFGKFFLNFIHLDLIVKMQPFLFNIQLISLHDKIFQRVKDILLNEPKIVIEFLAVNVVLNLIVKAYSLNR